MTMNMAVIDRITRMLLAGAVAVLYLADTISGAVAIMLGVIAVIFAVTSLVGFCPLYAPFKLSTSRDPR